MPELVVYAADIVDLIGDSHLVLQRVYLRRGFNRVRVQLSLSRRHRPDRMSPFVYARHEKAQRSGWASIGMQ